MLVKPVATDFSNKMSYFSLYYYIERFVSTRVVAAWNCLPSTVALFDMYNTSSGYKLGF